MVSLINKTINIVIQRRNTSGSKDVVALRSGHVRTDSVRDRQQPHTREKGIPLIEEKE